MIRALSAVLGLAVLLSTAAFADDPPPSDGSIKEGFQEIGRDIADTSKKVYDKAKDGTTKGVGTALKKTGEGFDKAADGLDHAGEKVEESGGSE